MNKDPSKSDSLDNNDQSDESDEHNEGKKPNTSNVASALGYLTQLGITMAATVMVGVFLGKFLDGVFNTSPWLLLVFSLLGAAAAIINLFNMSNKKN